MFLIEICQLRIVIVCQAKQGKIFLKFFLLFECKKVQFGPQNIIWGLKNGGWGGRVPGAPLDPLLIKQKAFWTICGVKLQYARH